MGGTVLSAKGSDDLLVFNAANNVLGNDFLSRINSDLRETKGWSYGVNASAAGFAGRVPDLVTAPVQADQTGPAITALNAQFNDFLKGGKGVTPAELERTVNGNTRRLAGSYETSLAVLNAMRVNDMLGRPDDYPETVAARTNALTTAELDAAAQAALDPSRFVWVVVGDASVVKPQLDALGTRTAAMLAISLHATNDALRDVLVPLNKKYPLDQLMAAIRAYPGLGNAKRVTFEYVMLKGVNDSPDEARALVKLIQGIPAKVNLIPFNPWPGTDYQCSDWKTIEAFAAILNRAGYASPIRTPRGRDILAACGQLKSESEKLRASALRKAEQAAA